mgnify:FL=1
MTDRTPTVELEAAVVLLAKVIESMRKNDPAIFAAILPHIHAFLDAYAREYRRTDHDLR